MTCRKERRFADEKSRPSLGEIQDLFFEEYGLQSSYSREEHLAERSFRLRLSEDNYDEACG